MLDVGCICTAVRARPKISIIAGGKTALSSQLYSKSPVASSLKLEVNFFSELLRT